ncbi:MAG: hypothetical protein K0R13_546 [Propionibacteriaceae bacterium]|jgi:hypothetical protein|nr:hypothetical protein [Propionibacteriaceae bacterium]
MPAGQHNEDRLQVSDLRFWGARYIVGIGRPSDQCQSATSEVRTAPLQ